MSLGFLALQLIAGFVAYFVVKCIYRITLHPLARFPGSKWAGMTHLFAMSWDMPEQTSYVKEFTSWHKTCGPIVRIEPGHLHISDIDAYNEIFRVGSKFNRDPMMYSTPLTKGSMLNVPSTKDAILHRSLYTHYFTRSAVQNLEPIIQEHLAQFLGKIDEAARLDHPIDLSLGFRCLMADTLMRYLYDQPFGALNAPGFRDPMILAIEELLKTGPAAAWYGGRPLIWLFEMVLKLPRTWMADHFMAEPFKIFDNCKARAEELSKELQDKATPTVLASALNPNIKKGQPRLSFDDMAADGLVFFTAGSDTTSNALTFGIYHLIRNPVVLQKLRSEIDAVITLPTVLSLDATPTTFPISWSVLDKLPYLHGVIKEAIRLSFGVPGKLPRIVPPGGATLAGQFIPGGTTVSSTSYCHLSNPQYYADPDEFRPERWIQNEDGNWNGNGGADPEKYFVAFSRGSRNCIGINLAYAQLNYTIAYLVRNFEMRLHEDMTEKDMDWRDSFTTMTFGHLRIRVKRVLV